jgi:hypothetical protein
MTTRAAFAKLRALLLGSDGPAPDQPASPMPYSGPALTAYPLPRDVGPEQLPALRLALLAESRRARLMRQSKLASSIEADLRSVTHQILQVKP